MTDELASDDNLLGRVRQGDENAFAELFERHRDRLRRMVAFRMDRRLHGRLDASDVVQEAFLDARARLHHFVAKPLESFSVWLRLIASQRLIDLHRAHIGAQGRSVAREQRRPAGRPIDATTACIAAELVADCASPSEAAMRVEIAEKLEDALDLMDPVDREVIALRHFEELSNSEVAEVLAIEPSAASKRYVRALRRFRELLADVPGFQTELL